MRRLFAWDGDVLVGRFDERHGEITFAYSAEASYPISLSLPRDGGWGKAAPAAFLDGLLPEEKARRIQMKGALGAASIDAFDLLERVDSAGGLVFTSGEEPPRTFVDEKSAAIATDMDIESQMQRVYDTDDAWWNAEARNRFSLAGNQGKFSLARIGGLWFWPNAIVPSTHIVKPDGRRIHDVAQIEHATLEIARRIGLPAARTETVQYGERKGLLVERFDRMFDDRARAICRLRTEDMTQAMGAWGKDKYDFEISDLVRCLRDADVDSEVAYDLIRQIAFNSCIGNHDAHAKNYSIFIDRDGVRLAPLYDAISMAHWPKYRWDVLAMPVNGVYDPWEIGLADWREEAKRCDLDADRVEGIVRGVAGALREFDYGALPCSRVIADEIRDHMNECSRDLMSN